MSIFQARIARSSWCLQFIAVLSETPEKAGKPMTGEESGFTDPLEDYGITGFQDADKVLFCLAFW